MESSKRPEAKMKRMGLGRGLDALLPATRFEMRATAAAGLDDPVTAVAVIRPSGPVDQTWNEEPQPQLLTTFGLLKTNPRFSRPS